jgi:large subunit ribosomal protein L25
MAQQVNLQAATRSNTGKGAARTFRRAGKVPAVIYGHGREPEALVVDAPALSKMLMGISAGSTIVDVTVDGRAPVKVLIREIQRNPIRPADIMHVDLYEIHADEKITVEVPVHLTGTADGVRNFGGVLDHILRTLEIEVFPGDIPASIDLDVTPLGIGQSLYVRDIKVEKAEILNDEDLPVVTVVATRAEEVAPAAAEEVASTEPELIRKPKAEEEEPEAKA